MNKGVLLVNLGSPDSPSVPDVRRYLREFLMDGRVMDVAWPVRFCIVHFRDPALAPEGIRPCLSVDLDTGRLAAGGHQPECAEAAAGAGERAGGTGDALPESRRFRLRVKQLAAKGVDELLVIAAVPALRDVEL